MGLRPEVQHFGEAVARTEIQRTFEMLESISVSDVGILDAEGMLRFNATAPQIGGDDFSWRKYYQESRRMTSGDGCIVEFIQFRGAEAGLRGVLVAVPLFETNPTEDYPAPSGEFAGVVVCTVRLDTITERFVALIKSSERGHAFLVDDESNVLWAPDESLFASNLPGEARGFTTFREIVDSMISGDISTGEFSYYAFGDSVGEYTTRSEEKELIAYVPIQLGNESWSIGVWAPKAEARQLVRTAYVRQLCVVALSILLILLGSAYALAASQRTRETLAEDVEVKTGELRESRDRLATALERVEVAHAFQQSVIDGVADPTVQIDRHYHVRLMNRAAREFSSAGEGTSASPLCYQVSHRRDTPCDGIEHPCPLEQVRASGQPVTVTHDHHQIDGESRAVEIVASPLWGEDGAFRGIIESARDITDRKRAEEALRQGEGQLRELNEQLEDYARNLQQRVVERTQDIERHRQVAESLRGVLTILNTGRPLGDVLEFIVGEASRLLGSQTNAIYRLDQSDGAFTVQTVQGTPAELVANVEPPPILGRALQEGAPPQSGEATGSAATRKDGFVRAWPRQHHPPAC